MQIHNAMHQPASITSSLAFVIPEIILVVSICITLVLGLFLKQNKSAVLVLVTGVAMLTAICFVAWNWPHQPEPIFAGTLRSPARNSSSVRRGVRCAHPLQFAKPPEG
jgi:NADH:ubiquinone oxidoreductase subunit 2 (subunit N)